MEILKDVVIILVCIVALGKGASWLVDSAVAIAKRFGISELVIGLTVVAFGTSAPEFSVTILAAIKDATNKPSNSLVLNSKSHFIAN